MSPITNIRKSVKHCRLRGAKRRGAKRGGLLHQLALHALIKIAVKLWHIGQLKSVPRGGG